jgi:DNA-binding transcriptional ArsR family regulator
MEREKSPAHLQTTPDTFNITDLETLKAVSTPFRQNLMRLMADEPRTVKEMAQELGTPPSRLYYHINQLEKHGIIRVVKTQVISGIIEKQYQLSARDFRVDRALLTPGSGQGDAAIEAVLLGTLDAGAEEIRQGIRTGVIDMSKRRPEPGTTFIGHSLATLTPQQYSDFLQRLFDLYQEFERMTSSPDEETVQLTGLLVALYPTTSPSGDD